MTPIFAAVDGWILGFSAITVVVTIWMGFRSAKTSKTASDFFVAGRSVSVGWNASAISGEYLSAASFMGIAGMVMSSGYDALWYPVCYACGYLFLLLFIAGPLRRFGAYTIPDFAEGRYDSPVFRKIAVCFVLFIGFFYTMPQMKGAGTTLAYIFPGLPYWAGVVLVGAVITLNVALGGMKGITLVQAFQYWAKMFAISVPIFVLMAVYGHYGKQLGANGNIQHPTSNVQHSTNAANVAANFDRLLLPKTIEEYRTVLNQPDFGMFFLDFTKALSGPTNLLSLDALKFRLREFSGLRNSAMGETETIGNLVANYSAVTRKRVSHGKSWLAVTNDISYDDSKPKTRRETVELMEGILRTNGGFIFPLNETNVVLLTETDLVAIRKASLEKEFGMVRKPLPEKAPADSTGLPPFIQKLQTAQRVGEPEKSASRKEFSLKQAADFKSIQNTAKSMGMEFALKNALGTEYREVRHMATGDPRSVFVTLYWLGGFGEILWVDSWTNFPVKLPPSAKTSPGGMINVPRDEAVKAALDALESVGACLIPAGTNRCLVVKKSEAQAYENAMLQLGWISDSAELRKPLPEKAPKDETWLSPFGPLTTKAAKAAKLSPEEAKPYSLLYTYSLIIALICGTAGLPHILVRFYTNPDGGAAKRTTMWVMILIGIFYVFPPVFGVMGRNLFPELYSGIGAKGTDKIVLELPRLLNEKYAPLGSILSGITCAGAFAAFMSTFSGLLVSMTGALAHDVYGRMLRPKSTAEQRMRMFKFAAVLIGFVSILLGSLVEPLEINFMVGQAFAIAAASYFPLLFMSVWWRGMTMRGAAVGMLTGGLCALVAATLTNVSNLALDKGPMGKIFSGFAGMNDFWAHHPLLRILCEQPAIWTVPLAITLMIVVSKATRKDVPPDVRMKMLVLHAPEKLGLKQEYIQEHQAGH